MSHIHIQTEHRLGLAVAKERVESLAKQLQDQLAVEYKWNGNTLEFSRSGASGKIVVDETSVTVDVELGIMLAAFKGELEKQLNALLQQHLG